MANPTGTKVTRKVTRFPKGNYKAFTIARFKGPGGLWVMRTLTIRGKRVLSVQEDVEDLWSIKMGRVENALEMEHQS